MVIPISPTVAPYIAINTECFVSSFADEFFKAASVIFSSVFNDGSRRDLFNLKGTIPVVYKSKNLNEHQWIDKWTTTYN